MALLVSSTMAWADGSCGDGVTWSLTDGALTISKTGEGTGAMADYGYRGAPWYESIESITSISIGEGVTSIGANAFADCNNPSLTSVTIPSGVTSIGDGAFGPCSYLASVTIPSGVTSIGVDAFYRCTNLTSVVIPSSVTSIGRNAFCKCTSLTSVTIPSSVKSIGINAFNTCSNLATVTIGSGVTSIGEHAFFQCTKCTDVYCYADPDALTWNVFFTGDESFAANSNCHVPAEHLDKYTAYFNFSNGTKSKIRITFVGDLTAQKLTVATNNIASGDLTRIAAV